MMLLVLCWRENKKRSCCWWVSRLSALLPVVPMTLLELEDLEEEVVSAPSFCWKIKNIVLWHMKRCLRDAGLTLGGADLTWPDLTCWTAEIKCELDREQGMKKLPNFIFSFSTADWRYMFYICALASNIKHLHQPRKYKVQENPTFYSGQELILYILMYPIDSQNPGEPRPWLLCPYTPSIPDYSSLSRKLYKQCLLGDDTSHLRATGKDRYKGTSC